MLGSRSVVMLINDMTPRMSASTTQMKMVIGLLTLRRESIGQSPFWESRAADRAAVFRRPTGRSVVFCYYFIADPANCKSPSINIL